MYLITYNESLKGWKKNDLCDYDVLNKPGPAISVLSINSLLGMFWTIFSAISLGLTFCPLAFIILKTHIYQMNSIELNKRKSELFVLTERLEQHKGEHQNTDLRHCHGAVTLIISKLGLLVGGDRMWRVL